MADTNTNTTRETDDLAQTMAEVQHQHSKAAEQVAAGRMRTADHHLFKAFSALGDYLNEGDWKVEPAGDDADTDTTDTDTTDHDHLWHLRRAIDAAPGEWTREILRGAHDEILNHREGQTDD